MQLRPALLLCLLMLMSGCVIQPTNFTGSGLVIDEFSPDFSAIASGDEVHLNLKVSNTGSVDASVVGVELTGLDLNSWKQKYSTCGELSREPIKPEGSANCAIALVAPDIGNLGVSFTPKVYVTYKYRTNAIALVSVGTTDELRRVAQRGQSLSYTSQSSAGPISIAITPSNPVKASGGSAEFPVRITVTNGGGTACSGACTAKTWNKIKLSLGTSMKMADCPSQIELILYKGQANAFVCNLKASASDAGAGITKNSIEVTSEYGYIVEAETALSIERLTV